MILNLRPDEGWIDSEYFKGYSQEAEQTRILKKLIPKGSRVWDIGIYRGFYTLLFSDLVGDKGKVVSIDLDKRNCIVVQEVLLLNQITNTVVYNYGLYNKNINQQYISSHSSNSRLLNTLKGNYTAKPVLLANEKIEEAELITFNSLTAKIGFADLIKVDIDGAELYALESAEKIFLNENVVVVIESHNHDTNKKITDFFRSNQCVVYSINEKRFFKQEELYWGTSIGCKNRRLLDQILT